MTEGDIITATEREIEQWPGARCQFTNGGKHSVATVIYRGGTRKVVFAKTMSDNARGLKNHLSQVRRELRALGAAKVEPSKSEQPRRKRNAPVRRMVAPDRAPVVANGFDALATIKIETPAAPPKQTIWQRIKGWFA